MTATSAPPVSTFMAIVDSLSDAVVIVDSSGSIVYGNKTAENTVGYSVDEILGKPSSSVVLMGGSSGGRLPIEDNVTDGVEVYVVANDMRRIPCRVSCIPLDAQTNLRALVIRDITDEKLPERRLRRSQQLGSVGTWERDIRSGRLYWSFARTMRYLTSRTFSSLPSLNRLSQNAS